MSVEAIEWVLNRAPDVPAPLVVVLVGLANHADPAGRGAAPSQRRLAFYARKTERTVRRDLAELAALGIIRRGDQRRVAYLPADRRPVVWDLAMDRTREVPAGLDACAEPQSGRPAALPVDKSVENPEGVGVRPVAGVRPVPQPGGRRRPPDTPSKTSTNADRGDAHARRTNGLEEVPPPPTAEPTAAAVRLLLNLPDPWRIGRRTAEQLAPAVAVALAEGRTDRDLHARLSANPEGVKSAGAVLRTRLNDLPSPPRPRTPAPSARKQHTPGWCGRCREVDRMVPSKLHSGKWVRCPVCHPGTVAMVVADRR